MASTISLPLHRALLVHRVRNAHPTSFEAQASKPASPLLSLGNRRQLLFSLTAATILTARESASMAEDIPLFGLRKKLRKVEEEAVEVVREGFVAAEKGIETAEKGIETVEKGIVTVEKEVETAEREIETAVNFGGLAQAGTVAVAEVVGVLVATSIVNGILGPEA